MGQVCQLDDLTDFLVRAGYTRCDQVEGPGQFALRGGILDVFSPGLDLPLRMEFWGDEIDSIGLFDPVTQRRTAQRETCELLPAGEVISLNGDLISGPPDLALPQVYPQVATAADYLPPNALGRPVRHPPRGRPGKKLPLAAGGRHHRPLRAGRPHRQAPRLCRDLGGPVRRAGQAHLTLFRFLHHRLSAGPPRRFCCR